MATLHETQTSLANDVNHNFPKATSDSVALPWQHCGGCESRCAISPFDDLREYGIHCHSKPEDLNPERWLQSLEQMTRVERTD